MPRKLSIDPEDYLLHRDQETLTQQEYLPASPSSVFNALTDPDLQVLWAGSEATGKGKVGNKFMIFNGYISGRYLDLQSGKRILEQWRTAQWPEGLPSSVVEITLAQAGEATMVTLVQSLIPHGWTESVRKEWINRYWIPLRVFFERINGR
jgi:uncharacterized protein YndB with AHSA1/START domain